MNSPNAIGRYLVRDRLGQGGMGVLFLALDPAIDRLVALKLLRVNHPEIRERFIREARLAARLQHPNIVTIFDVGEHQGQPFIAMEYIPGETLAEIIARRPPLPLARKLAIMADVCSGLAYAHRHGIVHRDVKPANLMVSRDSHAVKILDFGIARGAESTLTQVGMVIGTPNYMSPEQVEGRAIDTRSDIFAVGAVLYELLTYRQAFRADTQASVLYKIVTATPDPVAELVPGIDPSLTSLIERMLSKSPDHRPADLGIARAELMRLAQRLEENQQSHTLVDRPTPPPLREERGPATPSGRDRLTERQVARLNLHMATAEAALAEGDPDRAATETELAAKIDPDDPRIARLERRVRRALNEREAATFVAQARRYLDAGELTQAGVALGQAQALAPDLPEVSEVRQVLDRAIDAREQQRERARRVKDALDHARAALEDGALDAALRATNEALGLVPTDTGALGVRKQVQAAIDAKARTTIAAARAEMSAGRHTAALRRLETFAPVHDDIVAALAELRSEIAEIERARQERDAARRALEAWVASTKADAEQAIIDRRWGDALADLDAIRSRAPNEPGLDGLSQRVDEGLRAQQREESADSAVHGGRTPHGGRRLRRRPRLPERSAGARTGCARHRRAPETGA